MKQLELSSIILMILWSASVTNAEMSDFYVVSNLYEGTTIGFHGDNIVYIR